MNEHKYNVVQFLESPPKDIADYWCVSRDWVQIRGPNDPKVKVTYPSLGHNTFPLLNPLPLESQLMKRKKKGGYWSTCLCIVKYRTDSYEDAKRYMREVMANEDKYKADEALRLNAKTTRKAALIAKIALELMTIPENNHKANTTAQKRKAPDTDRKADSKGSKLAEPNEIVDEVAGLSQQAFELINDNQSLSHVRPVEDTDETKIQHRYSTEDKPTVNEYAPEANHSLHAETTAKQEIFTEFCKGEIRKLRANEQVFTPSLITKTMNKIMSNFNACSAYQSNNSIASTSMNLPQEGSKLNETQTQEKDDELLLLLFIIYPLLSKQT